MGGPDTRGRWRRVDVHSFLAKTRQGLSERLLARTEHLRSADAARLVLAKVGSLLALAALAAYATVHGVMGDWMISGACWLTMSAFTVNLWAYRRHGNIDLLVYTMMAVFLLHETWTVAYTGNLASALSMWGVVPVGGALLLRNARQLAAWLGVSLATCSVQLWIADPQAFRMAHPYLTLLLCLLVFGFVAASYARAREWIHKRQTAAEEAAEQLGSLLPICSYCKQIRDDDGYWRQVDAYLVDHQACAIEPSLCPECAQKGASDPAAATLPRDDLDPTDRSTEPTALPSSAALWPRLVRWFSAEGVDTHSVDRPRLAMVRVTATLAILGHVAFITSSVLLSHSVFVISHPVTIALLIVALVGHRWHRSIDVTACLVVTVILAKTVWEVSQTGNVGDQLAWWGVVPLAASLMLADRRLIALVMLETLVAFSMHILMGDPERFVLNTQVATLATAGPVYGALAVAYIRTRAEAERQALEAERTASELKQLFPICTACKQVRDDEGYWQRVESYFTRYTSTDLTHSVCPACMAKAMEEINSLAGASSAV